MEYDILDILEQLGYNGPLLNEEVLVKASEGGLSSPEYIDLCVWLTSRLKRLCCLEENLSADPGDIDGLQFEISGLLKELSCPYATLVSGDVQQRLKNKDDCLKLILFLSSELQAAQVMQTKSVQESTSVEQNTASPDLRLICRVLGLSESECLDPAQLFSTIETKISNILERIPKEHIGKPVLKSSIGGEQWAELEKINTVLSAEYECRRRMLIKRLDVTVQSFSWSERAKDQIDSMAKVYQPKRHSLKIKTSVSLEHLLAAREDICNVVKTSSGSSREKTTCAINKILMGRVPDRGGRPSEIEAPPPEMPPWQKRQEGGGRGGGWGGRGGGRGGGGGGKGGWGGREGGGKGGWGNDGGGKGGWGHQGGGKGGWGHQGGGGSGYYKGKGGDYY
ncbi:protein FAM98B [Anguilla rostrata]|uniref:protein FAM98B n=1 Tax=Anguilla rostrata TaxID=7938 RepID=UPI0030D604DC